MIKNIIFDLGNVIINYNQKQIINNFTEKEEEIKYIYNEIFHAPEEFNYIINSRYSVTKTKVKIIYKKALKFKIISTVGIE